MDGQSVYQILEELLAESQVGSNGLIFLPYLIGERSPRWNPNVRGCFVGIRILAQVPAVRKLRGNFDLGLFVAVLFLVTIGFAVDLKQFFGSTFYITLFCFCVIACSILLHLLITRLLKVRFEYVLLSIVGCISDGPTAALIASSAQWKTLINIGLLMGVLAGALGNYVGIGVAYAIRAFIGA